MTVIELKHVLHTAGLRPRLVDILRWPASHKQNPRQSKGKAFAVFETDAEAEACVKLAAENKLSVPRYIGAALEGVFNAECAKLCAENKLSVPRAGNSV